MYLSHFSESCGCAWPSRTELPFSSTMPIRKYQKLQCSKEFARSKGDNDLHNKLSTIGSVKGLPQNRIKSREVYWAQKLSVKTSYRHEGQWTNITWPFFSFSIEYEPASSTVNRIIKQLMTKVTNGLITMIYPRCSCAVEWYRQRHVREHSHSELWLWKNKQTNYAYHFLGFFIVLFDIFDPWNTWILGGHIKARNTFTSHQSSIRVALMKNCWLFYIYCSIYQMFQGIILFHPIHLFLISCIWLK